MSDDLSEIIFSYIGHFLQLKLKLKQQGLDLVPNRTPVYLFRLKIQ